MAKVANDGGFGFRVFMPDKMLLKVENTLLRSHRQRETTGIKKLYNSFFVMF